MRLIDADAYIKYCDDNWIPLNVDAVNAQPTVDAVSVVRCKDCEYCKKGVCWNIRGLYSVVSDMEYCSRAERRDSNDTNTD